MGMRALLLVAVVACDAGAKPARPRDAAPVDLSVHMERTRCYGSCPAYQVDIASDGTVSFVGEAFVVSERGTRRISRERLRAISELVDAAQFFELRDEYVSEGCTGVWTDNPTTKIRIVRAGKTKTIERYHGCEGAPIALDELAAAIDVAAGTAEWVGPPKRD
jgi:hypothetical protein